MPEATEDAVFLIATSYQALGRANTGEDQTITCNSTVVLIFAAFFIEANLTHILEVMGELDRMRRDVGRKKPGLYPKLAWFYDKLVRHSEDTKRDQLFEASFKDAVYSQFPGLEELVDFRNGVAHGKIDRSRANPADASRLRQHAKDIVTQLFAIAATAGHEIPRSITYAMAISSNPEEEAA